MNKEMSMTALQTAETRKNSTRSEQLIAQCESRLEHLLYETPDERVAQGLVNALRDLTALRLELGRPLPQDKRADMRFAQSALVTVFRAGQPEIEAALWDLSVGGALVETDADFAVAEACEVSIPGLSEHLACRVLAAHEGLVRLSFDKIAPERTIALLKHIERSITRY